jgi:DNA (cytosine-5)-methyltransferase 1
MRAYYNENDPKAAAWLRELIKVGAIAPGTVDERSIEDVTPNDLRDFTQHHFFAGIGGWSFALRLAGWPDHRPVWTGSCPCQPFSSAGAGRGFADERHLWPAWLHLMRAIRPEQIFGEQVATAGAWIDLVQTDLEAEGYAVGSAVLGAHSVGAPHVRQRLYWVAEPQSKQSYGRGDSRRRRRELADYSQLGHADQERQQQHAQLYGPSIAGTVSPPRWADTGGSSYVDCRDGKRRPVEPGTFPLAHGVSGRVGLLRGYGNAIVPQVAAKFIGAYCAIGS